MQLLVLTGDHFRADPEKPEGRYGAEDLRLHALMADAMSRLDGFEAEVLNDHAGLLERLRRTPPALLVNFCDTGYRNDVRLELHIPAYCELLGVPYTGASPSAIAMCYDKATVRLIADAVGIPVPGEHYLAAGTRELPAQVELPVLLKPNTSDGSFGIRRDAVVRDRDHAREYLAWLAEVCPDRDVLAQEFLPGDEIGLALIGNPKSGLEALQPLRVDYSDLDPSLEPILAYESKTEPLSPYVRNVRYVPANLSSEEQHSLIDQSQKLFARLGLQDYARFDYRRDQAGTLRLMEVNPNPAWDPEAKLALMAGFGGLSYPALLKRIVTTAWERARS